MFLRVFSILVKNFLKITENSVLQTHSAEIHWKLFITESSFFETFFIIFQTINNCC